MTDEMTPENARQYLRELFAKAGKADPKYITNAEHLAYSKHITNAEHLAYLSESGARVLRKTALGLSRHSSIKSLDEVAELFVKTNIASSLDEAKALVLKVVSANKLNHHAIHIGGLRYMVFEEVKNSDGNTRYRITAWTAD